MRLHVAGPFLESVVQVLLLLLAAVLLFWNLTARYLWQDEAATAVLSVRMLQFGRPLGYDGKNLLTTEILDKDEESVLNARTGPPEAAVRYFAARGDFKPDTTWKWQPWGLFLICAAGIELLGRNTLGARLPFALAGLATVLLFWYLVRRQFHSFPMAVVSCVLLCGNAYWILHARQARYYSVSSLAVVVILWAFARWQWRGHGPAAFIAAAWCGFQVDYGTVLPILAVLFIEALIENPRAWRRIIGAGLILAATLAPFVYFYDLAHRGPGSGAVGTWNERFLSNLFNMNEYVVPVLIVAMALALVIRVRKTIPDGERRLVTLGVAIFCVILLWIPTVTVFSFVRYCIVIAPVGAMLTAWVLVRLFGRHKLWLFPATAALIVFPWASLPLRPIAKANKSWKGNHLYRHELADLRRQIFKDLPDSNRLVIDYLRLHSLPSDEILINYEDYPLMYYLPNPIRGGIATFRVTDDEKTRPRFVIFRRSADWVHWPVFEREVARYQWERVALKAPDVPWGNNPDPVGDDDPRAAPELYIARRIGP